MHSGLEMELSGRVWTGALREEWYIISPCTKLHVSTASVHTDRHCTNRHFAPGSHGNRRRTPTGSIESLSEDAIHSVGRRANYMPKAGLGWPVHMETESRRTKNRSLGLLDLLNAPGNLFTAENCFEAIDNCGTFSCEGNAIHSAGLAREHSSENASMSSGCSTTRSRG